MKGKNILVIGGGGHGKVLIDALLKLQCRIEGIIDSDPALQGKMILGVKVFGGDEAVSKFKCSDVKLVNGIGSIKSTQRRIEIFERFSKIGYEFASVIHPSATIASDVTLASGVQIMAGAIIQTGVVVGANSIVNTGAIVDHDSHVAAHVHIAPGVCISGGVTIGEGAHIGSGATVIQGIKIGERAVIGAGSVVLKNVPNGAIVAGVPAKSLF